MLHLRGLAGLVCLLAGVVGGASAHLRHLRSAAAHRQPALEGSQDACGCLSWQHVYKARGVKCGQGNELHVVTKSLKPLWLAQKMVGDEFCEKFFHRIPASFCVNVDQNNAPAWWFGGQWCYVSSECKQLRGGHPVQGTNVSWKMCTDAQDETLREKTPEELDEIRGKLDLDLGLLVKFAYPVWQLEKWPHVESFFAPVNGTLMMYARGRRADLQRVVNSGIPMLFDSLDGHPPFYIVTGRKRYKINFKEGGLQSYIAGHMGEVNNMTCLEGCSQ